MALTAEKVRWIYERMVLIRAFEDRLHELFAEGRVPGFVHLYAGQEAVAVGVCANLNDSDYVTSTHRSHGHCIAKGLDVNRMMAELFGRTAGLCRGKGGQMHLADMSKGMLGANGIVGGAQPLACGAALTAQLQRNGAVAVTFFGDGAAEQGTIHETMNLAARWKLPLIFVCENNGFAEASPFASHCSISHISDRAVAYGMPGFNIDGSDAFEVNAIAGTAIARARAGDGPSLIEARTWRYYGMFEGDTDTYRLPEQHDAYRVHDPLTTFAKSAVDAGLMTSSDIPQVHSDAEKAVDDAIQFAESAPWPAPEDALKDVYVAYR